MDHSRREFISACVGAATALTASTVRADEPKDMNKSSLGVVIHSFANRVAADRVKPEPDRFEDAANFVKYAQKLGVSNVQVGFGGRSMEDTSRFSDKAADAGITLERIIRLPRNQTDLPRFREEVAFGWGKLPSIARAVMLNGRRYESFDSAAAFRRFADEATQSLLLAKRELEKYKSVLLAIENHKDLRADELIAILKRVDSEYIGVCLDTGNSISLLEDPMETVEKLAPWTFTTHFKDMAVKEYEQGFLLAEVPFGEGIIDLKRIVRILKAARPEIHFNVEMITRDPLRIPCLTDKYWATFEGLPGIHLARTLAMVRDRGSDRPLPKISDLAPEEKLKVEEENVRRCIAYAKEHLGL